MDNNPGFYIGNLKIHYYGVIIAAGMVAAILVGWYLCRRKKMPKDMIFNLALAGLPCAIVGARLYYIIFYGVSSFWQAFAIWDGGMAIYGGVIGGFLGILLVCRIKKYNLLQILDIIAPCLILGQAIGRWGNFVNQEAYGTLITDPSLQYFPFAVQIPVDKFTPVASGEVLNAYGVMPQSAWFQATFFYESMCSLFIFAVLMLMFHYVKPKGLVVSAYLILYGIVRVVLEGLRSDSLMWGNVRVSQLLSGLLIALGFVMVLFIVGFELKKRRELAERAESPPAVTDTGQEEIKSKE